MDHTTPAAEQQNHLAAAAESRVRTVEVLPAVDIVEENDKATVTFEVPGANSGTVSVEVKDAVLTVEAGSSLLRNGCSVIYKRAFQLADSVEVDQISAKTRDGVLTLVLPKSEQAQVHRITVE